MTWPQLIWGLALLALIGFIIIKFPSLFIYLAKHMKTLRVKYGSMEAEIEFALEAAAKAVNKWEPGAAGKTQLRQYLAHLPSAKILWVDDEPEGNRPEIEALQHAGLVVDIVRSNHEASQRVAGREYDLVLSDIGRKGQENPTAGLLLPKELMIDRNRVPPIIYYVGEVRGDRTPEGYPVTNLPTELFRLIRDVLLWKRD
jgi:CheY-like chemotaxis protein